jgi:hypothetical protein
MHGLRVLLANELHDDRHAIHISKEPSLIQLSWTNDLLRGVGFTPRHWFSDAAPLFDRLVVGAIPTFRHRRQPSLLAARLETQPAVGEFRRDCRPRYARRFFADAAFIATPPFCRIASLFVFDSALHKASLGG